VRLLRLGVLAALAGFLALAGGAALAASRQQAVFRVTMTATLTKTWTFTRAEEEQTGCVRTTRGTGRWQLKLSKGHADRVRAIAAGSGRVRFTGATLAGIVGAASRTGTMTVTTAGVPPCKPSSHTTRCPRQRKTLTRGSSSIRSPRRGRLALGSLRGSAPARSFPSRCLEEPADIRSIRTDLPLATGPLGVADVFDRNVESFFVTGDTEQVTTLEGAVDGRVTERVRWMLVFRRLPH
jgi:hypothetical protein